MKIEKISENQVKFILNQSDLTERNIKLAEIQYGSEKTQALFRDMMEQAMVECGFNADNTPLMIEALPVSTDSIMIIVTKVANGDGEKDSKFSMLPFSKEAGRYKSHEILETQPDAGNEDNISIYSFENLDDAAGASHRLWGYFTGDSVLFKNEKKYFLLLQNNNPEDNLRVEDIEAVLNEYGQKHISTIVSKYYLSEHGELLIDRGAVDVLAEHLG